MSDIEPTETDILGGWFFDGTSNHPDEACRRIERLTTSVLQRIANSRASEPWETLFRDPRDGRLWERTYPQGELHGGGPPRLIPHSRFAADFQVCRMVQRARRVPFESGFRIRTRDTQSSAFFVRAWSVVVDQEVHSPGRSRAPDRTHISMGAL
jgi:hypothetical protein